MATKSTTPAAQAGGGVLTFAIGAGVLSATGLPVQKTLDMLVDAGVPELAARAGLHAAPVLAIVVALLLGRALGRGRSPVVRWALYGLLGGIVGFGMAFCVDFFAGLAPAFAGLTGELAEATLLDAILYIFAAYCIVMGVIVGAVAVGGSSTLSAIQLEEVDPECLDVRKNDRKVSAWAALGLLTLGVACCALAFSRQVAADARLAPVIIAAITAFVSIAANWKLWADFDEMQRRHVVDGYAVSAIAATLGAFAWAMVEALGYLPALDAIGVFLLLLFVQTIAVSYVTTRATGQMSAIGKPA